MVITELAVVAEIGDVVLVFFGEAVGLAGPIVDPDEHLVERRAEIKTAAASVADVGDAREFLIEGSLVF
ncbi:MAG: hypothetical protein MPW15_01030 [Candidatus Manganitrophus sp.]|nr:hypothetical protein [Candidatus Manganitrophus sp.]